MMNLHFSNFSLYIFRTTTKTFMKRAFLLSLKVLLTNSVVLSSCFFLFYRTAKLNMMHSVVVAKTINLIRPLLLLFSSCQNNRKLYSSARKESKKEKHVLVLTRLCVYERESMHHSDPRSAPLLSSILYRFTEQRILD